MDTFIKLSLIALVAYGFAVASNNPGPGSYKNCRDEGIRGDTALNLLKNRSAQVPTPRPIQVDDIKSLPIPSPPSGHSYPRRSAWPAGALKLIAEPEATGVAFEGILVAVKQQGPERATVAGPI
jgi:hypothetical protein